MKYDLIIIGAGPAGLTAGIYAGRRNIKTLIIGETIGGQMASATAIENYPGFESVSGLELAKVMEVQARKFGCEIKTERVVESNVEKKTVKTDEKEYSAKAIIIATGTHYQRLGVKKEEEFLGRGISYCASCDAPFFKNKKVAVVGGSDAAIAAALYLKEYADVFLIHRRDELRAEIANQKKLFKLEIPVLWKIGRAHV